MKTSRRGFLGTTAALPALAWTPPQPATSPSPRPAGDSSFDPWVEVHAANLKANVAEIARRVDGRPILAVAKNNGYGLGVVNVARLLEGEAAIAGFAVVKMHEACAARDAGVKKPVLLMGPFDEQNLGEILQAAAERGVFVRIDMEDSPWVDTTLNLYRKMRQLGMDTGGSG